MAKTDTQLKSSGTTVNPPSDACKKLITADFASNEDLISSLPDEIITQILSFIPIKSSVATSVLSKRWNHVWTLVPNLDFDSDDRIEVSSSQPKVDRFMDFVDRVLCLNKELSVRKIHLDCFPVGWEIDRVINWINATVTRDVLEIFYLHLPFPFVDYHDRFSKMYSVPASFFNRKNLVNLKLRNIVLKVPAFVCFPSLRNIDFKSVFFVNDDDPIKNLLCGCPALKSLCLAGGVLADTTKTINICSATLLELELDNMYRDHDEYFGYKVAIDAQNLRYIKLEYGANTNFDIINVSSLVKASLCLRICDRESDHIFGDRVLALLRKISHVKELILDDDTMESFEIIPLEDLPMFNNLTLLDVGIAGGSWWPLCSLFHCIPNLVNLLITMRYSDEDGYWYEEPHQFPHCLLSSLENVEIVHENEDYVEMGLICFILKYAMVLKRLLIQTVCVDFEKEANIIEELQTLQKGSPACHVEYKNLERLVSKKFPYIVLGR